MPPEGRSVDVHLWVVDLASPTGPADCLGAAEKERIDRLKFETDKTRYTACRSALRYLLGAYCSVPPGELGFSTGPSGKPSLIAGRGPGFSVSHTGDLAVIAISRAPDIGVDIEAIRSLDDPAGLASSVFHADELAQLSRYYGAELIARFFKGWTRKEAYLKALGMGLTIDPRSVKTGLEPAAGWIEGQRPFPGTAVHLQSLQLPGLSADGYECALAVVSAIPQYRAFRYAWPLPATLPELA